MNSMNETFKIGDKVRIVINKRKTTEANPQKWLKERDKIGEIIDVYKTTCRVYFASIPAKLGNQRCYKHELMELVNET